MVDVIRLSDDEVVAVAARAGAVWMGPLPTVDDGHAEDLLQAFRRGERSLVLRGGVVRSAEGATYAVDELASYLGSAFGDRPRVLGFVAGESEPSVPVGVTIAVFADGDEDRIVSATQLNGITEFSRVDKESARRIIQALSGVSSTASEDGTPLAVVLVSPDDESTGRALTVTAEASYTGEFSNDSIVLKGDVASSDAFEAILARV